MERHNKIVLMPYTLELTCSSCPEQYDVFMEGKQVAYFRVRHGGFSAECPDVGGDEVYYSGIEGDGEFSSRERAVQLSRALDAVTKWLDGGMNAVYPKGDYTPVPWSAVFERLGGLS